MRISKQEDDMIKRITVLRNSSNHEKGFQLTQWGSEEKIYMKEI